MARNENLTSDRTPFLREEARSSGLDHVPIPSLISKELSAQFRKSLAILLALDVTYYFLGSVAVIYQLSAVDMLLLMLGYYAQDLFRPHALFLYMALTVASLVVDGVSLISSCVVIRTSVSNFRAFLITIMVLLYLFESSVKLYSVMVSNKLRIHLQLVPGQSII